MNIATIIILISIFTFVICGIIGVNSIEANKNPKVERALHLITGICALIVALTIVYIGLYHLFSYIKTSL